MSTLVAASSLSYVKACSGSAARDIAAMPYPEAAATTERFKAMDISPVLLTKAEAALVLNVSRRMIDRMCADGRLPPVKIGKFVRFERSTLDELIATGRRTASM
jgi:excisionase family DNA binding protein